jgi:serine/threonine protein kinase
MEFVPGGELYPLLQKEDLEIDWPLRLKIAHDVASALAFMHQRNIIHRDIVSFVFV